jgi:hypothetical protein
LNFERSIYPHTDRRRPSGRLFHHLDGILQAASSSIATPSHSEDAARFNPSTGMKPGERYEVESLERTKHFPGFFLDGKYYLGPELMTVVGWLEGQTFYFDELDPTGEPVFANGVAGTIENLTLTLADGARLNLNEVRYNAREESTPPEGNKSPDVLFQHMSSAFNKKLMVITGASSGIGRAAAHAFAGKGARLVLAARDESALDDVIEECTARGASAFHHFAPSKNFE